MSFRVNTGDVLQSTDGKRTYIILSTREKWCEGVTMVDPNSDDPLKGRVWRWQDHRQFVDDGVFSYRYHPDPDAAWAQYCAWQLTDGKEL